MSDFRSKLNMLSALSADWDKPAEQPPAAETFLDDLDHCYPLDTTYGNACLDAFPSLDSALFFGLNDLHDRPLDLQRILFLDTETTGLFGASVQAFLVGLGFFREDGFHVRQLLMRSLGAEAELLARLAECFDAFDTVVTFNGKSFDIPLIETRMTFNRMRINTPATHIDLIHPARRIYKLRIENCSLSNIEERIFGASRIDDLDGSLIPGRYFRYIHTGDETLLTDILDHNRQDILSMPLLASMMCSALAGPDARQAGADLFSIGRYYMRQRNTDAAQDYFSSVPEGLWSLPAQWQRSLLLKKQDPAAAAACWEDLLRHTPDYCPAMIELSKYHEHTSGDIIAAYRYCADALETRMGQVKFAADLQKRRERLRKKLSARGIDPESVI